MPDSTETTVTLDEASRRRADFSEAAGSLEDIQAFDEARISYRTIERIGLKLPMGAVPRHFGVIPNTRRARYTSLAN